MGTGWNATMLLTYGPTGVIRYTTRYGITFALLSIGGTLPSDSSQRKDES